MKTLYTGHDGEWSMCGYIHEVQKNPHMGGRTSTDDACSGRPSSVIRVKEQDDKIFGTTEKSSLMRLRL
jgi:hypothetical protein